MRFPITPAGLSADYNLNEYTVKAAEAWELGALVLLDGNELLTECAADPTVVLGVSAATVAAGDLDGEMAGLGLGCGVFLAEVGTYFWAAGDNDPVAADVNRFYGAAVDGDGVWYVDGTETTTTVFYVVRIDTTRNLYLVQFKATVMQIPVASS